MYDPSPTDNLIKELLVSKQCFSQVFTLSAEVLVYRGHMVYFSVCLCSNREDDQWATVPKNLVYSFKDLTK